MRYVTLGKTGLQAAEVSFGGIPIQRSNISNARLVVDQLERYGMNYIDTARGYTVSEEYLGAALEGRRNQFLLATKSMARDKASMAKDIETSLHNLRTDHIDVYQIHNLPLHEIDQVFGPGGAWEALEDAKTAGKVGHLGVTAHNADALAKMIELHGDRIETVMFPYNIVEIQGHEILKKARELGIATIAMKPMAGGNLEDWNLALKFIAASGVIDISIPGMGSPEEAERNAAAAEHFGPLTPEELDQCERIRKELGTQFCRRCGYCAPCPNGINIPSAFLMANYAKRYGLADWAKSRYNALPYHAGSCVQCGACERRCPYNLPIRDMLEEVAKVFGY